MSMLKSRKKLPRQRVDRILIRGTNWVGDAVLTLPAIASVRAAYPRAHISILAKPLVCDVYKLFSAADEIIIYRKELDTVPGVIRLARILRKKKFDAAILLQNAIEAAIIAFVAGVKIRAGYNSDGRGILLTHSIRRTKNIREVHQVEYYLEMVKALGCPPVSQEMYLQANINRVTAQSVLRTFVPGEEMPVAVIAPGAIYGPAKRWFPERFAAVAENLRKDFGCRVILLGGKEDWNIAQKVKNEAGTDLINLAGKTTLREAIYLISQSFLFIGNDSGLMHIAGALNIPTVAVFGSTNPATTSPVGEKTIIVRKEVSCSPCLEKTCPTDFRCMETVAVDDVMAAVHAILKRD